MKSRPRIVLYHATPVAMEPVISSMARLWPEAEAVNLLDDGLTIDRAKEGAELSDELTGRFVDFGRYAHRIGADGILVTCSAFGPAIEKMADELPVPVLKPNEAMFRDAIAAGGRIGMLATFAPAISTMTEEFGQFASDTGAAATLDTIVVADAIDLLRKGDAAAHNRLVAARAPELARHDAIMLAHFSTSRAAEAVRAVVDVPVLSAPDAAVLRMRALVNGEG
ncbi:aspartate/glutamate racemase family protein [Rhizobium sp. TRM96647]|uniref:aspartate/glutamate racemase family protein n=1 Tax=unclassified Rhizobium TaxID=2613769 RepID=UPI0021E8A0F5|nr:MULTISPECIES: aspartate/glutamate racemase family protein [unclassified Rhizobium]MCV3736195.1 aspartate/glutamate racemase family protein [Rhizobium sp. TRM96647]MCV3758143.1 aspartate/glutamate racemase family protein [Rhizobium sp. TRM96650]